MAKSIRSKRKRKMRNIKREKYGKKELERLKGILETAQKQDVEMKDLYTGSAVILSFQTDMPGQTVQTQIRLFLEEQSDQSLPCSQTVQAQIRLLLLRSSLIRVYTVCHSVCIVWTHYSMVEPHSSNFRVITTNILGVRIFRKFTVIP